MKKKKKRKNSREENTTTYTYKSYIYIRIKVLRAFHWVLIISLRVRSTTKKNDEKYTQRRRERPKWKGFDCMFKSRWKKYQQHSATEHNKEVEKNNEAYFCANVYKNHEYVYKCIHILQYFRLYKSKSNFFARLNFVLLCLRSLYGPFYVTLYQTQTQFFRKKQRKYENSTLNDGNVEFCLSLHNLLAVLLLECLLAKPKCVSKLLK